MQATSGQNAFPGLPDPQPQLCQPLHSQPQPRLHPLHPSGSSSKVHSFFFKPAVTAEQRFGSKAARTQATSASKAKQGSSSNRGKHKQGSTRGRGKHKQGSSNTHKQQQQQ